MNNIRKAGAAAAGTLRTKEVRRALYYMLAVLVIVRIGSQIPVPGVDREFLRNWFAEQGGTLDFFSAFTGGSFENMSVFALSVTPYITSSIIMQLLTVAFPSLEEMARDGEEGRKKLNAVTRFLTAGLAVAEALSMTIGFGNRGLIPNMTPMKAGIVVIVLAGGSTLLMWIGEQATKNGIGNGISWILLINILSKAPQAFTGLYEQFVKGRTPARAALAALTIFAVIIASMAFVVVLEGAVRNIPVRYSKKAPAAGVPNAGSSIPLKVNTSGVIAVIFASSLMSMPGMITAFAGIRPAAGSVLAKCIDMLNQSSWFDPVRPWYTAGLLVYAALVIFFAYFYTSITFNPMLMADSLKKSGGVIPGIRPGIPTERYLSDILRSVVFIGAAGLLIAAVIPVALSNVFHANIPFGGTSLIIIAGVITDIIKQAEAKAAVHNYRGLVLGQ